MISRKERFEEILTSTTRDEVLSVGIEWNKPKLLEKWIRSNAPAEGTSILNLLPRTIDRNYLLSLVNEPELLMASLVWGYGNNTLFYGNIVSAFSNGIAVSETTDTSKISTVIHDVSNYLATNDISSAFKCFYRQNGERNFEPGEGKSFIKGMNTAFVTKIIYVLGQQKECSIQPLIYDKRVARTISELLPNAGYPLDPSGLLVAQYEEYCRWANEVEIDGLKIDPTVVEFALFIAGKKTLK